MSFRGKVTSWTSQANCRVVSALEPLGPATVLSSCVLAGPGEHGKDPCFLRPCCATRAACGTAADTIAWLGDPSLSPHPSSLLPIPTHRDGLSARTSWGTRSVGHPRVTRALQSPCMPPTRLPHAPRPCLGLQIVPSGRPGCSPSFPPRLEAPPCRSSLCPRGSPAGPSSSPIHHARSPCITAGVPPRPSPARRQHDPAQTSSLAAHAAAQTSTPGAPKALRSQPRACPPAASSAGARRANEQRRGPTSGSD